MVDGDAVSLAQSNRAKFKSLGFWPTINDQTCFGLKKEEEKGT